MSQFRNKMTGNEVSAIRWWRNGDHPLDDVMRPFEDTGKVPTEPREGAVIRYFRLPDMSGDETCPHCGDIWHNHGFLDGELHRQHAVCPGDWVIDVEDGSRFIRCHADFTAEFELTT